jgi:hypothetical protein
LNCWIIRSGLILKLLLIIVQLINSDSSFKLILIIPSSTAVLNQNRFGLNFKTINNGFKSEP